VRSGHAPDEMADGVLEDLLLDLAGQYGATCWHEGVDSIDWPSCSLDLYFN